VKQVPPATASSAPAGAVSSSSGRTGFANQPLPLALQRPGCGTLADAFQFATQLADSPDRAQYAQDLLRYALSISTEAALETAAAFAEPKLRDLAVNFALGEWARVDAPAALEWAATHPRDENDSSRLAAAFEGLAAQSPDGALSFLQRPELVGDVDALSRIAIYHFADQGRLDDARRDIERLPEGELRTLLVERLVEAWAERDAGAAAAWLASTSSDATFRTGMNALVHRVAEQDPTFAAGLAQRFPDSDTHHDLIADVVYVWAKRDLGSAAAWIREQPQNPKLDGSLARLAELTAPNDPNEARSWLDRIANPTLRAELAARLRL
jgi:hypothetical protein